MEIQTTDDSHGPAPELIRDAFFFEHLPFAAFGLDRDCKVVAWNHAMAELTAFPKQTVRGQDIFVLLANCLDSPVDLSREKLEARFTAKDSAGIWAIPIVLKNRDDQQFTLLVHSCQPLKRDTRADLVCTVIKDRDSLHKRLLELSPGMAYQIRNDGRWTISYVSTGSRELTGHGQEHFQGKTIAALTEIMHPQDVSRTLEDFYAAVAKREPFEQEFRVIDSSGREKWLLNRGQAVFTRQKELVCVDGYLHDISAYKLRENRLREERRLLRTALRDHKSFGRILGSSPAMHKVYDQIINAAMSENSVCILGETGTGKELVARAIHDNGPRAKQPFLAVNCGAIPETLIEEEFFGYKKGAFTGADKDKEGFLEKASGGTLFLDEIGEISLGMQVKLLRALETEGFTPLGGTRAIRPDVRIIAASHKNLPELVKAGTMRRDFFYRIYVIPMTLPPLRERGDDVVLLADSFLADLSKGAPPHRLTGAEQELFKRYTWPGNVRELQNAIHRYLTLGDFNFLSEQLEDGAPLPTDLDLTISQCVRNGMSLGEITVFMERQVILNALKETGGHKLHAAQKLKVSRRTLFRKIKELGITSDK